MPNIDPELWVLVHGGFEEMNTWPVDYWWAALRTGLRFVREALDATEPPIDVPDWKSALLREVDAVLAVPALQELQQAEAGPAGTVGPLWHLSNTLSDYNRVVDKYKHDILRDLESSKPTALTSLKVLSFFERALTLLRRGVAITVPKDTLPMESPRLPADRFIEIFREEFQQVP